LIFGQQKLTYFNCNTFFQKKQVFLQKYLFHTVKYPTIKTGCRVLYYLEMNKHSGTLFFDSASNGGSLTAPSFTAGKNSQVQNWKFFLLSI